MPNIIYHHENNIHSSEGAIKGIGYFLRQRSFRSLLDVGAGNGNWLRAARLSGVVDVLGVDGVVPERSRLCVEPELLRTADLRAPLRIGRRFDAVLCLEVAEHIPEEAASTLIGSLCAHGDTIFFSAAAPGQHGEQHINCQTPEYWQVLFNKQGYTCVDSIRLQMWQDGTVEPWYRQNVFVALRDPARAGHEPRIPYLIHPEMTEHTDFPHSPIVRRYVNLERGALHPVHYLKLFAVSARWRVERLLRGGA